MNLADLSILLFPLTIALTAGLSAASEKAGWSTALFIVGGLTIGFLIGVGVRWLMNRILVFGGRQQRHIAAFGSLVLYTLIPFLFLVPAIHGTGVATAWLVRHLF